MSRAVSLGQTAMLVGKLVEQVKTNPVLAAEDPSMGIINQAPVRVFLKGLAQQVPEAVIAFLTGIGSAWESTTSEPYDEEVRAFRATSVHPRWKSSLDRLDLSAHARALRSLAGERLTDLPLLGWRAGHHAGLYRGCLGHPPRERYWFFVRVSMLIWNTLYGHVARGPGKLEQIYVRTGHIAPFAGWQR